MSAAEHLHSEMSEEFHEEHVEHADERWLMSYADMMTLLFGLFVMLYAMMDNFSVIQQSASAKFSSSKEMGGSREDPAVAAQLQDNATEKIKIENETLRVKAAALETMLTAEKAKVAEANAMMEIIKVKADTVIPDQSARMKSLERERDRLRAENASLRTESLEASNQNLDNARKANEPKEELRADGLGGQGGHAGGGKGLGRIGPRHEYQLTITMPDNSTLIRKVKNIGPNGVQLDEPLTLTPGQKITIMIKASEGHPIEIRAKTLADDDGHTSNRLKFISFTNGEEMILMEWLARPPPEH